MNSSAARNALVLIAVIAAGAALLWLNSILTPLALALFLMVMVDSFARVIKGRFPKLPQRAVMPLSIAAFVIGFGVITLVVAGNATTFVSQLIADKPRLDGLLARLASAAGIEVPPTVDQLFRQLDPTQYVRSVAQAVQNLASQLVFVFIYLGFLLASRSGFRRKAVRLFHDHDEREHASAVFVRIRDGIERYLWIQTVTGLMIAGASWALMALVGLNSAFFWAFLIFIACYIPIVGGIVGVFLPPVFALVQFDTYWQAIVLLAGLQSIQFVVGNVIQTRMQGEGLNLDPVVVLLSLALWGALWGVPGMFLSTPLTVMAMVILAQFRSTRWMAILLSGNGHPERISEGPSDPSKAPHSSPTPQTKEDQSEKPARPRAARKARAQTVVTVPAPEKEGRG